ncbi:MAG: dihydrofolate reductase family protein [Dermatophilaceae bacterium]
MRGVDMRKVMAYTSITLDGVMQSPGHPDEDTRGGFTQGGWASRYADDTTMEPASGEPGDLLLGRRTFEKMRAGWEHGPADNPFTPIMNASRKYVTSRTLTETPTWHNSVLLAGEATDTVARLTAQDGPDLVILGSGELTRAMLHARLVDTLVLLIHPLVLGHGIRLFQDVASPAELDLVGSKTSSTGVIVATYRTR